MIVVSAVHIRVPKTVKACRKGILSSLIIASEIKLESVFILKNAEIFRKAILSCFNILK